jgi:signal transduction histidine kinase
VLTRSLLVDRERAELELTARTAILAVDPGLGAGDPLELPAVDPAHTVGVYDTSGVLRAGGGPQLGDPVVTQALTGVTASGDWDGDLVVAVPVTTNEQVTAAVRTAEPAAQVWRQVALGWALLAAAAGLALTVGVMLARQQARRLTQPLELLSAASQQIAEGDLSARAPASQIREINQVGATHNAMVDRLAAALERERQFSADASHQLRTPLAGLQLELETALANESGSARPALVVALSEVRRLQATVDDVLTLARTDSRRPAVLGDPAPVSRVVANVERRWHGPLARDGRPLRTVLQRGLESTPVPGRVVEHILDVLLENARVHGQGAVTIAVRDAGGALAVSVTDEGHLPNQPPDPFERGASAGGGPGIGLALARTIAETVRGRLLLTASHPSTFTLFLPTEE